MTTIRVVMLRHSMTPAERERLKEYYYDAGWPKEKTIFVFDPAEPKDGQMHLANLQRHRSAGEEVVVVLEPEPLPMSAMRAGFPHIAIQGGPARRVAAVQPQFQIFVPDPPPAV